MHASSSELASIRYRLRDYRPGDEDAVVLVVREALAEFGLEWDPHGTDSDLRNIYETYVSPGGSFRVLQSERKIVGCYGIYPMTPHSCELRKMYLGREIRGLGYGRKMMDDALQQARERGFLEMTLESNSCLTAALRLYTRFGFREFTPDHLSGRCNLAMRRAL